MEYISEVLIKKVSTLSTYRKYIKWQEDINRNNTPEYDNNQRANICKECLEEAHPDHSCSQVIESKYENMGVGKSLQLCPVCYERVYKPRECNHMICYGCGHNFCIFCRGKYTADHLNPFNPYGCVTLQKRKYYMYIYIYI